GNADDGVLEFDVTADEFVGLADRNAFDDARHRFERANVHGALIAGDADCRASGARNGQRLVAKRLDSLANGANLVFGGMRLHDYQHEWPLRCGEVASLA